MAILASSESRTTDFLPAKSAQSAETPVPAKAISSRARSRHRYLAWNLPVAMLVFAGMSGFLSNHIIFLQGVVPYLLGAGVGSMLTVGWHLKCEYASAQRMFLKRYVHEGSEVLVTYLGELGHGYNERAKLAYYYGGHLTAHAMRRQSRDMLRHINPAPALSATQRLGALLKCDSLAVLMESIHLGTEDYEQERWEHWSDITYRTARVVGKLHQHLLQNPARTAEELTLLAQLPAMRATLRELEQLATTVEGRARDAVARRRAQLGGQVEGSVAR